MKLRKIASPFRIGHGFDVHRFEDHTNTGYVILAGIRIPSERSLIAHSDGDVVAHAICDALLGAIAAGDIGKHYPDTDARFRGIDSMVLLKDVYTKVCDSGYRLGNLDDYRSISRQCVIALRRRYRSMPVRSMLKRPQPRNWVTQDSAKVLRCMRLCYSCATRHKRGDQSNMLFFSGKNAF